MSHCHFCNAILPPGFVVCNHCGAMTAASKAPPAISPQLEAELRMLLDEGQKIQAIKHLRESTGAGLAEAKLAVERIEQGLKPLVPSALSSDQQFRDELSKLLRAGRKIEAIKLYRVRSGAGLKEAKDAVEAMGIIPDEAGSKAGCLGVLILLTVGATIVASL